MTRKWSVHWAFTSGQYQHWEIRSYGTPLGICVTNGEDQTVTWHRYDHVPLTVAFPSMAYGAALRWIEQNQGESFPSRRT